MNDLIDVTYWKEKLTLFVAERGWNKQHNPKNLAMDLVVEATELMNIFTWATTDDTIQSTIKNKLDHMKEEIGDVLITLILISKSLNINLSSALEEKLKLTKMKYPID